MWVWLRNGGSGRGGHSPRVIPAAAAAAAVDLSLSTPRATLHNAFLYVWQVLEQRGVGSEDEAPAPAAAKPPSGHHKSKSTGVLAGRWEASVERWKAWCR